MDDTPKQDPKSQPADPIVPAEKEKPEPVAKDTTPVNPVTPVEPPATPEKKPDTAPTAPAKEPDPADPIKPAAAPVKEPDPVEPIKPVPTPTAPAKKPDPTPATPVAPAKTTPSPATPVNKPGPAPTTPSKEPNPADPVEPTKPTPAPVTPTKKSVPAKPTPAPVAPAKKPEPAPPVTPTKSAPAVVPPAPTQAVIPSSSALPPLKADQGDPYAVKNSNAGKGTSLLLLLLTAILFATLGAAGYWYYSGNYGSSAGQSCTYNGAKFNDNMIFPAQDQCNECFCNNGSTTCTSIACTSGDIEENTSDDSIPFEEWETFVNTVLKVTFKYPANWYVTETAEGDPAVCETNTITASNNENTFEITIPCSTEPDWCVFEDTDTSVLPEGFDTSVQGNYQEIQGDGSTYRRSLTEPGTYKVCELDAETGLYTPNLTPAYVKLLTPVDNAETTKLDILDQMLQSLKLDI